MTEYKLWKVLISYDAHCIDGNSKTKVHYRLPGRNQEEALQKARNLFSEGEWKGKELVEKGFYEEKGVDLDNYQESVTEYRAALSVPKISGPDSKKFTLTPRISDDGKTIEFIVDEK